MRDAGLADRVARIRHHDELRLGPGLVQVPGGLRRRGDVVAALDDHAGNVLQAMGVADELPLLEQALVDEIVVLDPGEGDGVVLVAELVAVALVVAGG